MTDLPKPAYGEACNRCGQCCMRYPCPIAQTMFDQTTGQCPALEQDGEQYGCGLVLNPQRYDPLRAARMGVETLSREALEMICVGTGCDAIFAGERTNQAYRDARAEEAARAPGQPPPTRLVRALAVWGLFLKRRTP